MAEVKLNIYQKMLAIQTELQTVAKNLSVSTGTNTYKAVSERDVIDAVKPLEAKYGVYSYPKTRNIVESDFLEKTNTKGYTTKSFYLRLEVTYEFINVENPQEVVSVTAYGDGIDTGDKATGKAMTYADKYALMKAYKISTGDDPDKDASDTYNNKGDDSLLIELLDAQNKLGQLDVDRHTPEFIGYVNEKAGTNFATLDPMLLIDNQADCKKVLKVLKAIIKAKTKEVTKLDVKDETPTY